LKPKVWYNSITDLICPFNNRYLQMVLKRCLSFRSWI